MAKTAWSVQAIDDLSNIEDYLAASSKKQAEMGLPHLRELIIKQYRVVYYLNFQDEIEIVTIRHSARPLNDTSLPMG